MLCHCCYGIFSYQKNGIKYRFSKKFIVKLEISISWQHQFTHKYIKSRWLKAYKCICIEWSVIIIALYLSSGVADAAGSESPLAGRLLLTRGGVSPPRPERQRGHAFAQDDRRLHLLTNWRRGNANGWFCLHMVSYLIKGRRDCAFIVVCLFRVHSSDGLFCLCFLWCLTADVLNAADVCKVFRLFFSRT